MYKNLEYQLGGSSNILDDILNIDKFINFINENKIIIFLVIAIIFLWRPTSMDGFISYETMKKKLSFFSPKDSEIISDNTDDTDTGL